jgi:hypothetical protein
MLITYPRPAAIVYGVRGYCHWRSVPEINLAVPGCSTADVREGRLGVRLRHLTTAALRACSPDLLRPRAAPLLPYSLVMWQ